MQSLRSPTNFTDKGCVGGGGGWGGEHHIAFPSKGHINKVAEAITLNRPEEDSNHLVLIQKK